MNIDRYIKLFPLFLLTLFSFKEIFSQDLTPEEIFQKVDDAIVVIHAYDFKGNLSIQGSGVVIDNNGLIATNFHVIAKCEKYEVLHNGKEIGSAELIALNFDKDILILKVSDNSLKAINLGNSNNLKVGQRVYAIGSPMGLENSISEGIISGLRNFDKNYSNFIQITASISPGSSGGAVLNSQGELIGISTSTIKGGQNLNFAIPINDVIEVSQNLIEGNENIKFINIYIKGFNAYDGDNYVEAVFNLSKCVNIMKKGRSRIGIQTEVQNDTLVIIDIEKKSPAEKQGLKIDDKIIEINDENVVGLSRQLSFEKFKGESGTKISLKIIRENNIIPISVVITKELIPFSFSNVYYFRAQAYYHLKKYYESISDLTILIEDNLENSELYYLRANNYYCLEKYHKAIEDYSKAIEYCSNNEKDKLILSQTYYWRGISKYHENNSSGACSDWEKSFSLGKIEAKDLIRDYCK
jgi:S1-C subfamily serine protease